MASKQSTSQPTDDATVKQSSAPSSGSPPTKDSNSNAQKETITHVGHNKFGFDSTVDVETLKSLYLTPAYIREGKDVTVSIDAPEKDFSTVTTYNHNTNTIQYSTVNKFPPIKLLPNHKRKRILITGGAGFVGSHLVDRLMLLGHEVTVIDNLFTGSRSTVSHWVGHPNFELVRHDVVEPFLIEVDQIYHLACPASPPHYQQNAVKTLKTSFEGTLNMLGLAKRTGARFLITSTSEVYGDPEEHPQREEYWGHVNCIGPRACYDEGKRVAETLTYGYHRRDGVDVRVARIFNTFGPRMNPFDGRVVSNFILQALKGEDMTVYGDGSQTRSFQYVHDLIDGLILLMNGEETRPVNIGNGDEFTIMEFAEAVRDIVEKVQKEEGNPLAKRVNIIHKEIPIDDPQRRRPDTTRAKETLGWQPRWNVKQGIEEMVRYYNARIKEGAI
ncbi:uncharacterized protein L203_101496 [Cryptococcus depauperatus CBS 7841]|uniref:UDP-glucuronate decarboxylase n=1 Tax=Cryptococcus depauperatus CBS 7841 TaxID=1295531 RepID=A0A1E3ITH6_9TREE|nr:UDP-glucuronate decarboxylase [Cryptococcus depauperatus CBS 7841]